MAEIATETETAKRSGGYKTAIIAGIISGVIVLVFIQPILSFLWRFVLSDVKVLNDDAALQASLGYTDKYPFLLQTQIYCFLFGIFTAQTVLAYLFHGKTEEGSLHMASRIERVLRRRLLATTLLIVFIFIGMSSLSYDFLVLQMNASFNQRLAVLAPKISDQERKELLASWASMTKAEDYRTIVQKMESKAASLGVTLPKLISGAAPIQLQ